MGWGQVQLLIHLAANEGMNRGERNWIVSIIAIWTVLCLTDPLSKDGYKGERDPHQIFLILETTIFLKHSIQLTLSINFERIY